MSNDVAPNRSSRAQHLSASPWQPDDDKSAGDLAAAGAPSDERASALTQASFTASSLASLSSSFDHVSDAPPLLPSGAQPRAGGSRAPPPLPRAAVSDTAALYGAPAAPRSQTSGDVDARMKSAGVPAAQRERIKEHLDGLDETARHKELATLDHALDGKNASRAVATYDRLAQMAKASPQAQARLTPEVRDSLVRGVSDSRTDSPEGQKGVLGERQAEDAARALVQMPPAQYQQLSSSLARAGGGVPGADAQTERALLLKAVAARGDALSAGGAGAADAMRDVTGFADSIRGTERSALIQKTSTLGLTTGETGLYQRFDDSCGPTTAQNVEAERDPIYAMKLREDFKNGGPESQLARQQKDALERPRFYDKNYQPVQVTPEQEARFKKDGTKPPGVAHVESGRAVSRLGDEAELRLQQTLHTRDTAKLLSKGEHDALTKYSQNRALTPAEQKHADDAIAKLRARDGGRPNDDELSAMRSNYTRNADGTSTRKRGDGMQLEPALTDIAPPRAGTQWTGRDTNGGRGGMSDRDLQAVDERLTGGTDVPIRIANADGGDGHFMMIGDVRGNKPDRRYLVSDPWTGKTAWVPERDIKNPSSAWPRKYFDRGLATRVTTTYAEQ
ncbi:MAG TPA: hypothetical protein VGO62_02495 [Myxococcota bacterium]